jgi:predicted dehydrogenase
MAHPAVADVDRGWVHALPHQLVHAAGLAHRLALVPRVVKPETVLAHLDRFVATGIPVTVGTSRKGFLGAAMAVQIVFIATPTHLHRRIVEDCLAAGKHVYCEAPLAHTIEDAAAIMQAARNARGTFACGLEGRLNPIYQLARTFFRSDSVRDLISMRGQSNQKTSWRIPAADPARDREMKWRLDEDVSIGLAGELGTHQFDVFQWFTDRDPVSVRGSGSIRLHHDGRTIADTVHCDLTWPDGTRLHYSATLGNSFERTHEVFYGSNAAIKLAWTAGWMFKEADAPTQGWEVYANRQQFHNDEGITLIADATQLAAQGRLQDGVGLPDPPLYYAINDFIKCVIDRQPVTATADVGYRATVVGILSHQAVMTGRDIAIDPEVLRAR